jgi:thiol-disulfide isomerase/thioredoxin
MKARRLLLALAVFGGFCFSSLGPAQEPKATLTRVNYDGLKQEVLKHRGKVVVVDFWATNCPPCIKALPHYAELQKKHASQGLVVITVSVDPADNPKKVARATEILSDLESPLRNLILDEPYELWSKKFEFKSLPFAYVFDRRGKWVRLRAEEYAEKYDAEVEKTITQLLAEK